MSNDIRVPSTTVELVQILGEILRTHLGYRIYRTECWTIKNIANWGNGWHSGGPERYEELYYASGHCMIRPDKPGNPEQIEIRASCQHDDWSAAGCRAWIIKIWVLRADGSVERNYFFGGDGEGVDRGICHFKDKPMDAQPPAQIAFKVKEEVLAS